MRRNFLAIMLCAGLARAAQPLYTIDTLAGSSWTGDGRAATAAVLVQPQFVTVEPSGAVYVSDAGDHRIRRINTAGVIQTVAGTGIAGLRGDGGPAAQAQVNAPYGMALNALGDLYFADLGNALVRRLGSDGTVLTVAGGGTETPTDKAAISALKAKLIKPRDVAVDRAGNLFIADFGAHRIYQVTFDGMLSVVAGTGEAGAMKAPGAPLKTPLAYPSALALDASGAVYIADSGNHRVRKLAAGLLSTLQDKAGREVEVGTPTGLAVDAAGRIYIADGASRTTVLAPSGDLTSVAIGGSSVAVDPYGQLLTTDDRQVKKLVADRVESIAGTAGGQGAGDGTDPGQWRFNSPGAVLRDAGGFLYIADTGNGRIRRLSPSGQLSTVTTQIAAPVSLAMDSRGRIYAGDIATGSVYRLEGSSSPKIVARGESRPIQPAALAFDIADNLFIADSANGLIRRVAPDGTMTVVAGGGRETGDGVALLLKLASPFGLAFDTDGSLIFSEAGSGRIRRYQNGQVTTIPATDLTEPRGIRLDKEARLWVADAGSHRVIRVDSTGQWTPMAGSGDRGFSGDGDMALAAMLSGPSDVLPQADGTVLIVDTGNHRIRRLQLAKQAPEVVVSPPTVMMSPVTVVHAGSFTSAEVAAGQLVYISGDGLANMDVFFGDAKAAVVAKDAARLTVRVPVSLSPGNVDVTLQSAGQMRGKGTTRVVACSPGILTADAGKGQALALNEDGSVNGAGSPVGRGAMITLFVTGEGSAASTISAEVGMYPADVVWWGAAPGLPGILQLNIRTPGGFSPSGVVPISLSFDGVRSQPGVTIVSR